MKDSTSILTYEEGLIQEQWAEVCERLGKERTLRLIQNGTTLDVANQIIQAMNFKEKLPKLF